MSAKDIRTHYFSGNLQNTINLIKKEGQLDGKDILVFKGQDHYILTIDDLYYVFKSLDKLIKIPLNLPGETLLPLEIGIDVRDIDEYSNENSLIDDTEVIAFLRNNILLYYREFYKQNNDGKSITHSFIVLTEGFHKFIKRTHRNICNEVITEYGGKEIKFYLMDLKLFSEKLHIQGFLEKIGASWSEIYARLDDTYVIPDEYGLIQDTLKKLNLVIITGPQECGKTFTSIKLLSDFYFNGYNPKWYRGTSLVNRNTSRDCLSDGSIESMEKTIYYFEDPFGIDEYEPHKDFENGMMNLVNSHINREVSNSFIIITSRDEVFKTFKNRMVNPIAWNVALFGRFEVNLSQPRDKSKINTMILNWSTAIGCKWVDSDYITKHVLQEVESGKILTPLSIKSFAIRTKDEMELHKILQIFEELREETYISFARELERLSDDKKVFLLLVLIHRFFGVVRDQYPLILNQMSIESPHSIYDVFSWFKDDKIEIIQNNKPPDFPINISYSFINDGFTPIDFSHPAYRESILRVISSTSNSSKLMIDAFKVIINQKVPDWMYVADNKTYSTFDNDVISVLEHLPILQRIELGKKIIKTDIRNGMKFLLRHFEQIPKDDRNDILNLLVNQENFKKPFFIEMLADMLLNFYHLIPINIRNEIFYKVTLSFTSDLQTTMPQIVKNWLSLIILNFSEMTDGVKNNLIDIINSNKIEETASDDNSNRIIKHGWRSDVVIAGLVFDITNNYAKLPKELHDLLIDILNHTYEDSFSNPLEWKTNPICEKFADAVIPHHRELPSEVTIWIKKFVSKRHLQPTLIFKLIVFSKIYPEGHNIIYQTMRNPEIFSQTVAILLDHYEEVLTDLNYLTKKFIDYFPSLNHSANWYLLFSFLSRPEVIKNSILSSLFTELVSQIPLFDKSVLILLRRYRPFDLASSLNGAFAPIVNWDIILQLLKGLSELPIDFDTIELLTSICKHVRNLDNSSSNSRKSEVMLKVLSIYDKYFVDFTTSISPSWDRVRDEFLKIMFTAILTFFHNATAELQIRMVTLVCNNKITYTVFETLIENYPDLDPRIKNHFSRLLTTSEYLNDPRVESILFKSFSKLESNVKVKITDKLLKSCSFHIDKKHTNSGINNFTLMDLFLILYSSFDSLPDKVKDSILSCASRNELLDKGHIEILSITLIYYFAQIPREFRNLLLTNLSNNQLVQRNMLCWILSLHYNDIPNEVKSNIMYRLR